MGRTGAKYSGQTGLGEAGGAVKQAKLPATPEVFEKMSKLAFRQQRFAFRAQKPITKLLGAQTEEALRTGGVGAQIPIIQQAVSQSNQATAGALRAAESGLESRGLSGTPFGERILAQISQQGRQSAAGIGPGIAQSFIAGAPGFIGQQGGTARALGGVGTQTFGGAHGAQVAGVTQLKSSLMEMIGQLAQGAGSAVGACDERLKTDIRRVGTSPSGFGIFEFRYVFAPTVQFRGPIAQNVQRIKPDAVRFSHGGLLYVDLRRIDVPIEVMH